MNTWLAPLLFATSLLTQPPEVRLPDESTGIDGIARTLVSVFDQADIIALGEDVLKDIRMGRKTRFEAVLENGYDPPTQLAQIALFNKLVDKFEIILDSDPRNTTLRGQEQPAGTEERTPSSKAVPTWPMD